MRLRQLRLARLRSFESVELELDPGWNVFVGPNGAGKTTLLEAAYLLSHARSFRAGAKDALVRRGATGFSVFGQVEQADGRLDGLGLSRETTGLEARINMTPAPVADLLRHIAVVCFEPGSHELISGSADQRRRFLDWGVFHVEQDFLRVWRAYQRALRQRNALLRAGGSGMELDSWDCELAASGAELSAMRARYVTVLGPGVATRLAGLLPELGAARLVLDGGWDGGGDALQRLAESRSEDLRRGFTTHGPHRADWSVVFENAPRREHLSRGQEKLCALGCLIGQAEVFADRRGEWPIICVDDLASELDAPHQEQLVESLAAIDAQRLITGTHVPDALVGRFHAAMFHVEPGRVGALL